MPLPVVSNQPPARVAANAFTLIELLVVIAIIGILAAMLMPTLGTSKNLAIQMADINNLKQIITAMDLYANDNTDVLPSPELV